MGNGLDEGSQLGPVQNSGQYDKVRALVEDARQRGGRVLTGGEPPADGSLFYPVTLVADVDHGSRLVDEEQFGPALPDIPLSRRRRGHRPGEQRLPRPRGLDLVERPGSGAGPCDAPGMRFGLGQQARRDPAQRPVRGTKSSGLGL